MNFLRVSSLSLFCLAAMAVRGQLTDEALKVKVSFESVAAPASRVIEQLASQTKVPMATVPATAGEILIVRVDDVPLAELMARLAKAASAEWRFESNAYRLVRPASIANAELREAQARRLAAVRKELNTLFEELKPKKAPAKPPASSGGGGPRESDTEEEWLQQMERQETSPGRTAILKLLRPIDPVVLANLEEGQRVVWSSNPTRMQRQLVGDLNAIITELIQAHNQQVRSRQNEPQDGDLSDEERKQIEAFLKELGVEMDPKAVDTRPAKALLIAGQQSGFMNGLNVELRLYDSNGKVILTESLMLGLGDFLAEMSEIAEALPEGTPGRDQLPKRQLPKVEGPDKEIVFSAATNEVMTILGGVMSMESSQAKLSAETEARLLRPDLYDPLSYVQSESLIQSSRHKKLNLVGNLPDTMVSMFSFFGGQTKSVNGFLSGLLANDDVETKMEEGWLTVRPAKPYESRRVRVDRPSLAKLLQASKQRGMPTLDDLAAYAQVNPEPMRTPVAMMNLMFFAPNAINRGMMGMQDWNLLRFYGTLTSGQKVNARQGVAIPFATLNPAQRALVERMAFGTDARLQVGEPKPAENSFTSMMRMFMPGGSSDWRQEPTEVMPNGLPTGGVLQLSLAESTIAASAEQNAMANMMGALGPMELAMFRFFKEDPNMAQMSGMMPQLNRVRLGTRKTYSFTFLVGNDAHMAKVLLDDYVDKNGAIVSMDQLPDGFKAEIDKAFEEMKKSPFGTMIGLGRPSTTRPPEPR